MEIPCPHHTENDQTETITRLLDERARLMALLSMASKIIGKVVEADLMPNIAAPGFPKMVLARIESILYPVKEA